VSDKFEHGGNIYWCDKLDCHQKTLGANKKVWQNSRIESQHTKINYLFYIPTMNMQRKKSEKQSHSK
jgi:hypothetical protein